MTTTFTTDQINAIQPGVTEISHGVDGRWGEYRKVVSIHAKRNDIEGNLFVCGYTTFGDNAQLSFSIKANDPFDFRHYRIK